MVDALKDLLMMFGMLYLGQTIGVPIGQLLREIWDSRRR